MSGNEYVLIEPNIKRKRPFSVCLVNSGQTNDFVTYSRAKSCLKRIDNSPLGKFQRCIMQKEAQLNLVKQKRVQFATELA